LDLTDPQLWPISVGSGKTYEKLSKESFNQLQSLFKNPKAFSKTIWYDDALEESVQFQTGNLKWNEALSKVAWDYLDDAAPCDLSKTLHG